MHHSLHKWNEEMTQITAAFPNVVWGFFFCCCSRNVHFPKDQLLAFFFHARIPVTSPPRNGVGFPAAGKSASETNTSSLSSELLFSLFFMQQGWNPSVDSRVEENELSLPAGVQDPTDPCHIPRKAPNQGMLLDRWNLLDGVPGMRKVQGAEMSVENPVWGKGDGFQDKQPESGSDRAGTTGKSCRNSGCLWLREEIQISNPINKAARGKEGFGVSVPGGEV